MSPCDSHTRASTTAAATSSPGDQLRHGAKDTRTSQASSDGAREPQPWLLELGEPGQCLGVGPHQRERGLVGQLDDRLAEPPAELRRAPGRRRRRAAVRTAGRAPRRRDAGASPPRSAGTCRAAGHRSSWRRGRRAPRSRRSARGSGRASAAVRRRARRRTSRPRPPRRTRPGATRGRSARATRTARGSRRRRSSSWRGSRRPVVRRAPGARAAGTAAGGRPGAAPRRCGTRVGRATSPVRSCSMFVEHEADRLGGAPRDAHVMVRRTRGLARNPKTCPTWRRLQERSELVEHRLRGAEPEGCERVALARPRAGGRSTIARSSDVGQACRRALDERPVVLHRRRDPVGATRELDLNDVAGGCEPGEIDAPGARRAGRPPRSPGGAACVGFGSPPASAAPATAIWRASSHWTGPEELLITRCSSRNNGASRSDSGSIPKGKSRRRHRRASVRPVGGTAAARGPGGYDGP